MKNSEKYLLVLVSHKGLQRLGLKDNILKFLHAIDFLKNVISKCKLRLLEPLKQPHLKMKMFFEREMLNPNNEKHLVKTIGYKLHMI